MITFAFVLAFGGSPVRPPVAHATAGSVDAQSGAGSRGAAPASGGDHWFGRDKVLHFAASAVIQGAAHAAFRSRGAGYGAASRGAALVTLTAGVGKEVWDHYHPGHDASVRDLTWDVLGGATGAAVVRQIDR